MSTIKPRLEHNARMMIMHYVKTYWRNNFEDGNDEESPMQIWRLFLISRRYVDSCFAVCPDGSQFTCIGVDLANAQIIFQPYFAEEHQIFGRKNMQVQFLILKLADFDSLEICLYSEMENHRCLLRLMELSQILKEKKKLERIRLCTNDVNLQLLLDVLPKKIYRLEHRTLRHALDRELDELRILVDCLLSDYHRILQTRAKNIIFWDSECNASFPKLCKCGPFEPNPYIESITINMPLDSEKSAEDDYYDLYNYLNDQKWANDMLPQYRQAFEYVYELNSNVIVKSVKWNFYEVYLKDTNEFVLFHESVLRRFHSLIDITIKLGIKLELQKFNFSIRKIENNYTAEFPKRVAETLGMRLKRDDNDVVKAFEHEKCKFKITYKFSRTNE